MAIDPRFFAGASDVFADLGYGVATGGFKNMFREATKRQQEMEPGRDAAAAAALKETEDAALRAKYAGILRSMGMEEHAKIVEDGLAAPGEVYMDALNQKRAAAAGPEQTASMRDFAFAQQNPEYAAFLNPPSSPDYPTSYDEFQLAQQNPDYAAALKAKNAPAQRPITEAQQRMLMINNIVQDEAKVLLGDPATGKAGVYGALGELGNQVLDANGMGRALTSGDYQRAASAVETISQHYLYALSGQAAPEGEVKRVARTLMPVIGENPASVLEKKRRLESYLKTIEDFVAQTGGDQSGAPAGGDYTVLSVE